MTHQVPSRRFSPPQLLVAVLVSALATFDVTFHVYRTPAAYPSHLSTPITPVMAYQAPPMNAYASSPLSAMYATNSVSHGFVPTNVCAYGRGACADSVNAPDGTPYSAYRQCADGKTAFKCKCFGVRGKAGAASPVSVVSEMLLPNGLCHCIFIRQQRSETSHRGMILGCQLIIHISVVNATFDKLRASTVQ